MCIYARLMMLLLVFVLSWHSHIPKSKTYGKNIGLLYCQIIKE